MANTPNVLLATLRTAVGKGAARRSRRAGMVPAAMYGHNTETVHLDLPGHDTFLLVKDSANAVVTIKYDGKQQLCLVKNVQVHPVTRAMLHVDLLTVSRDEKVEVEVPVIIIGESAPGTTHQQEEFALPVLAPATDIPEHIQVDITGLEEGTVLRVADITLPTDVEAAVDSSRDVVSITVEHENVEPAASVEEAAEEVAEETE